MIQKFELCFFAEQYLFQNLSITENVKENLMMVYLKWGKKAITTIIYTLALIF